MRVLAASAVVSALLGMSATRAPAAAPVDLRTCADAALQAGLEREIGRLGLGSAVSDHRLAVSLVDLSSGDAPRLAMLNGDAMMYATSLPKIAILLGAFVQAERGTLVRDEATLASLNRMIRNSSNTDASAMPPPRRGPRAATRRASGAGSRAPCGRRPSCGAGRSTRS